MDDIEKARKQQEIEQQAEKLVDQLAHFVSAMQPEQQDAFATALADKHPTYLGQIAKVVGIGVMRRADYNPTWRPYDRYTRYRCAEHPDLPEHPEHDGRLDCSTVIGAELMARQSFI